MKLFLDSEFTGLHQNTTLISIGLISEDDRTFYAEFNDYDKSQVDDWIKEHVINNLKFESPSEGEDEYYVDTRDKKYSVELRGGTDKIKRHLLLWLKQFDKIEMWSDCLSYDWVLFNELVADFSNGYPNLPNNVYYIPFDLATIFKIKGIDPDINREKFANISDKDDSKHNSLWDAKVIRACYDKLMNEVK